MLEPVVLDTGVEAALALMAQYIKLEITMTPVSHLLASVEPQENAIEEVVFGLEEGLLVHHQNQRILCKTMLVLEAGVEPAFAPMVKYIKLEITLMPASHLLALVELLELAIVTLVHGLIERLHATQQ